MVYGTHPKYEGGVERNGAYKTFRDLDLTVTQAARSLKKHTGDFDAILVTGVSGLSVGAPLALKLKKHLLVLRKDTEECHDMKGTLLGQVDLDNAPRVCFVDDLISSGETLRRCREAVAAVASLYSSDARITHTYVYEGDRVRVEAS